MKLLGPDQVAMKHQELPQEWALIGGTQLEISLKFDDFAKALDYVNKVAKVAEKQNHHPDVQLSYGKVELIVTTHSAGGLTNKDFEFAEEVSKIKS